MRFTCTRCKEEAYTGMTICAYGCRGVFLYHPAEVEIEVPAEEAPTEGFNLRATTDIATDSAWAVDDPNFQYQPEGRDMAFADADTFRRYLGSLVRGLTEIVLNRRFEPGRSPQNMGAMRDMIKKGVQHRLKWLEIEHYRLTRAAKCQLPNWGGAILKGPWVPGGPNEMPPPALDAGRVP